jgi:hypothetical protein
MNEKNAFMITLMVLSVVLSIFLVRESNSNDKLQSTVDFYRSTFMRKQGMDTLNGKRIQYELYTVDGGRDWIAVEGNMTNDNKITLGDVKKVYPGLLENIAGWDAIEEYVLEHGPIDISSTNASLLKSVGFDIKTNK